MSPDEVLENIKKILDELVTSDLNIKIVDIFNKDMEFHPKILSGLYCLNHIVNLL